MKKKILIVSSVLCVIFLIIAVVFFFLMKGANPDKAKDEASSLTASQVAEKIEVLKLNTYDEIKKYTKNNPVCIQDSDNELFFGIGDLNIKDNSVQAFYRLNKDGSINRFDGNYSYELTKPSVEEAGYVIDFFNGVVSEYFNTTSFAPAFYNKDGALIINSEENIYNEIFKGEATYGLSVIDKKNTYWYISISVVDKKYVKFEFFRCFDLSVYNDESPDIDLRKPAEDDKSPEGTESEIAESEQPFVDGEDSKEAIEESKQESGE